MVGEGGTMIALQVSKARKRVVGHFLAFHAIEPGDAVEYKPDRAFDRSQFEKLRARKIIREPRLGFYWLDVPALRADEDARRARLVPIVIALSLFAAGLMMLLYRL